MNRVPIFDRKNENVWLDILAILKYPKHIRQK